MKKEEKRGRKSKEVEKELVEKEGRRSRVKEE